MGKFASETAARSFKFGLKSPDNSRFRLELIPKSCLFPNETPREILPLLLNSFPPKTS